MKKVNMLDALNMIDDKIIENAIEVDSPEKLKEIKMKENAKKKTKIIKIMASCAACVCLILASVVTVNHFSADKSTTKIYTDSSTQSYEKSNGLEKIANPITELKSASEMKKYLGFNVPVLKDKTVKSYIVIGESDYATQGRIIYSDDSDFEMSNGTGLDISGIYGGKLEKTVSINNTSVKIYSLDDTTYAIWSDKTFSYSYSTKSASEIQTNIKSIMNTSENQ